MSSEDVPTGLIGALLSIKIALGQNNCLKSTQCSDIEIHPLKVAVQASTGLKDGLVHPTFSYNQRQWLNRVLGSKAGTSPVRLKPKPNQPYTCRSLVRLPAQPSPLRTRQSKKRFA